jgi:hypothetical protein
MHLLKIEKNLKLLLPDFGLVRIMKKKLLNGLSSGKPEWIKLPLALQPISDAWPTESSKVLSGMQY